jgi:hypothetical protein
MGIDKIVYSAYRHESKIENIIKLFVSSYVLFEGLKNLKQINSDLGDSYNYSIVCVLILAAGFGLSGLRDIATEFTLKYDFLFQELLNHSNIQDRYKSGLEHVYINDSGGLREILERTKMNYMREWGTVFTTTIHGNNAYINYIMNPTDAESSKIVSSRGILHVEFNPEKAVGFNGAHHYHPPIFTKYLAARNYHINTNDKSSSIPHPFELLSFKTIRGPELIAFNRKDVFIPKDRKDKSYLVKATSEDIKKYLL